VAAGYNSRLQRPAFVGRWVLEGANRGFASILRLAPVVASCYLFPCRFGPPLKRKALGRLMTIRLLTDGRDVNWAEAAEVFRLAPLGRREPEKLRKAFLSSAISVYAYDAGTLVGLGRALSDGEYQAAIFDVVVLPAYQGKGIGRSIVAKIEATLRVPNVILYAVPGMERFYAELGYRRMKTAMAKLAPAMNDVGDGYLE